VTDIASDLKLLDQNELRVNGALAEPLAKKIGATLNALIDLQGQGYKAGDCFFAFLDEAYVQSQLDTTWVEMKGQDITGSDLATLKPSMNPLPNPMGKFIRGNDTGGGSDPDAPRSVGSTQTNAMLEHTHKMINNNPANDNDVPIGPANPYIGTKVKGTPQGGLDGEYYIGGRVTTGLPLFLYGSKTGGVENRPQNVSLGFL
jgi:hypothetical protein